MTEVMAGGNGGEIYREGGQNGVVNIPNLMKLSICWVLGSENKKLWECKVTVETPLRIFFVGSLYFTHK